MDNLNLRRPQDASKVNTGQDWEVEYWCKEFGCTSQELKNAVAVVGNSADAVRRHLGKK